MTFLAFLLPFFFFIMFPSRMWNFDGVACAAALEFGNPVFFFHSNHLLYGFLGFLFWRPLAFWALPRALPALQLFTSLLSAIGLAGLSRLLERILKDRGFALLLTLCISVSAVVWVWSIEAQVYALGFLALSWATFELLRPEHPQKWLRMGCLHAAAVLGHIVHVLWIIPVLYWMHKENPKARSRHLRLYLTPLALGTVIPYTLVILLFQIPEHGNFRWLIKWLMGSASLNPNSLFEWHSAGWTAPFQWAFITPRIFWGTFWPYHTQVPMWCQGLTVLSIALVVLLLGLSWKQHTHRLWNFCVIWLAVYALFFWSWEPSTECYRMTDVIPLSILMALGLLEMRKLSWRWGALGLLFMTLWPANLATRIIPMNDEKRNDLFQATLALQHVTPENSLYLTMGGSTWLYLLYFAHRSAWNLHLLVRDPDHLAREIARHVAQQPVYISVDAMHMTEIHPWLSRYTLLPVADGLTWMQLQ